MTTTGCMLRVCDWNLNGEAVEFLSAYAVYSEAREEKAREKRKLMKDELEIEIRERGLDAFLKRMTKEIKLTCEHVTAPAEYHRCFGTHREGVKDPGIMLGLDAKCDFWRLDADIYVDVERGTSGGAPRYSVRGAVTSTRL
ncbi:MAG: hypothetical protein IPK81_13495 [Rhodospirillales bacterium]|nr:MAG: hypothetical protein IPK81_13495 [Rhodospirillales bacterium]